MLDLIGRTVSHYRIVEHLGGGGMGVVYKAEDTKLGRTVALKFLPPEWSRDPDARERFLREARAASALEDSRICTIFDIDETEDGQLFIAMAFYEGETLKKKVERGRLSIGRAVDIAIQVAAGLERAHSAGIIHRDIKPANLMLNERNEIVIVDFGLSKLAGDLSLTKSGWSLGTPLYMSPEQSRGDRSDERTDLWSLGVVLFEMLTGRPPFVAENHTAVARAILDDEPPPLDVLRPDAPAGLSEILTKALEKDASSRYQSAGEFLTDLHRLRNLIPETEGLTLSTPSQTPRRQRSVVPVVLAVVVFVVGAAAVFWFLKSTDFKEESDDPPPRIVVLPFENLGRPEDEYFADGMTEEITSRLSSLSGLHVISRTSAMKFKDTDKDIPEIGEALGVQFVLEGTVRWERKEDGPDHVRITPQLIQVVDDRHLWSDRFDRVIDSVFEVQSDIAIEVTRRLAVDLGNGEEEILRKVPTENREAHDAYLQGMYHLKRSFLSVKEGFPAAEFFDHAVELDPGFALAWARLSMAHSRLFMAGVDRTQQRQATARETAETAIRIDSSLPEGYGALGFFFYGCRQDYERALREYDKALSIRPNDAFFLFLRAALLKRQLRFREALEGFSEAAEIDPMDAAIAIERSIIYSALWEYSEAEEAARRAILISPNSLIGYAYLRTALIFQGKINEARQVLEEAPFQYPRLEMLWVSQLQIERRFQDALDRAMAIPSSVFEEMGSSAPGERAYLECWCRYYLGNLQESGSACEEAADVYEQLVLEGEDSQDYRGQLAWTYSNLGRHDDAVREMGLKREIGLQSADVFTRQHTELAYSVILARAGRFDEAIDGIEDVLANHGGAWISVPKLRLDPDWDPLRDHPRFQALLEEYETE